MSVGIVRTFRAGTATFSAYVPGRCSPRILYSAHSESSPRRQYSHRPHEMPGFTTTRSPASTSVTSEPTSARSEEHTSELQSRPHLVCRLLLEKKKKKIILRIDHDRPYTCSSHATIG